MSIACVRSSLTHQQIVISFLKKRTIDEVRRVRRDPEKNPHAQLLLLILLHPSQQQTFA
jgi:hypothetical protein